MKNTTKIIAAGILAIGCLFYGWTNPLCEGGKAGGKESGDWRSRVVGALEDAVKRSNEDGTSSPNLPIFEKPDFTGLGAYRVARVVDGDTFAIRDRNGERVIRLLGVDTPETVHPTKGIEEYGKEAAIFAKNMLVSEAVYLMLDPTQGEQDVYGRTLAYVYRAPDGLFVNAEILRQGYGRIYDKGGEIKWAKEFRELEAFAKSAKKGLWAGERVDNPGGEMAAIDGSQQRKDGERKSAGGIEMTVYITKTGGKYHRVGCRYLAKSAIPISLTEAKARYSPCSVCNPP